jgi:hypothetical protein
MPNVLPIIFRCEPQPDTPNLEDPELNPEFAPEKNDDLGPKLEIIENCNSQSQGNSNSFADFEDRSSPDPKCDFLTKNQIQKSKTPDMRKSFGQKFNRKNPSSFFPVVKDPRFNSRCPGLDQIRVSSKRTAVRKSISINPRDISPNKDTENSSGALEIPKATHRPILGESRMVTINAQKKFR